MTDVFYKFNVGLDMNSNTIKNMVFEAGSISNSWLATNPLARANHTGTQAASTISDLASVVKAYRLDEFAQPTADLAMNSHKLTGLSNGSASTDSVTYGQVIGLINGTKWLAPVRTKTTTGVNITLSGEQTISGYTTSNSRVLVDSQTVGAQNGIYLTAAGSWTRVTDLPTGNDAANISFFVEDGTYADTQWTCTNNTGSAVVGTDTLVFVQFGSGTGYSADESTLHLSGTTFSIKSTYTGQTSITTLGTIATGLWNGTKVSEAYGGTNQSTYALGDTLYSSATNTLAKLAGNTTTTKKFLRQTGDGTNSAAPAWDTVLKADVGLGNVENTALSTWAGTSSITTVGTVTSGTFKGLTGAYKTTFGDGSATSFTITHNLGSKDVIVMCRNISTGALEEFSVVAATTNTVTIACNGTAPSAAAYGVTVVAAA